MDANQQAAESRINPPIAFVGTFLAGMILSGVLGHPGLPLSGSFERTIGIAGLLLGAGVLFSAVRLFRDAGVDPWHGTPRLISEGVYGRSRHPMILGMAIAYFGAAIFADSVITLLLLVPLIFILQNEVIEPEEAELETRLGERYRLYRDSVRRWF